WRSPLGSSLVRRFQDPGFAVSYEEIVFFGVSDGPENHRLLLFLRVRNEADVEALNLFRAETVNAFDRPGPFQMRSRIEQRAALDRFAEPFKQTLLAGLNEHDPGRQNQDGELGQQKPLQRPFEKQLVKPGLRNLKSKLVVQRLCRCGDQAFGLTEQSNHA